MLLLLLLFAFGALALQIKREPLVLQPFRSYSLVSFGFEPNSRALFEVTFDDDEAQSAAVAGEVVVLGVTAAQYVTMRAATKTSCAGASSYAFSAFFSTNVTTATVEVDRYKRLQLLILNCETRALKIHFSADLLNPEAGELEAGMGQANVMYGGTSIVHAALLAMALLEKARGGAFRRLDAYLLSLLVLHAARAAAAALFYSLYAASGAPSRALLGATRIADAAASAGIFVLIFAACKGVSVIRRAFTPAHAAPTSAVAVEARHLGVGVVLLGVTLAFFSFYNEGYAWLAMLIAWFYVLPKAFGALLETQRLLELHADLLAVYGAELARADDDDDDDDDDDGDGGNDGGGGGGGSGARERAALRVQQRVEATCVRVRVAYYARVRGILSLYVAAVVLAAVMQMIVPWYYPLIVLGAQEAVALAFLAPFVLLHARAARRHLYSRVQLGAAGGVGSGGGYLLDALYAAAAAANGGPVGGHGDEYGDVRAADRLRALLNARRQRRLAAAFLRHVRVVQYPPLDAPSTSEARLALAVATKP